MFEFERHMNTRVGRGWDLTPGLITDWRKKMTRIFIAALVAWLVLPASADQVTIEPVKDNTLIENEDGLVSNALGPIFAGKIGPNGGFANLRASAAPL